MRNISLTFYEVRVYPKRKPKDLKALDHLEGPYQNIIDPIKAHINSLPEYTESDITLNEESLEHKLFLEGNLTDMKHQLSGVLRHGEDGISSSIFDGTTGKRTFKRDPKHIELMPFYFMIDIPEGAKSGIICLQTFGTYSVSTHFNNELKKTLSDLYSEHYTVTINVIQLGGIFIDKYLKNGKVKEIEGVKYFEVPDIADENNKLIKCRCTYSPFIRGSSFKPILNQIVSKMVKGEATSADAIHDVKEFLSIDTQDFDKMKLKVKVGDQTRKIDFSDISRSATKFDISDDVDRHTDNHPKFASIDAKAKEILKQDVRKIIKV